MGARFWLSFSRIKSLSYRRPSTASRDSLISSSCLQLSLLRPVHAIPCLSQRLRTCSAAVMRHKPVVAGHIAYSKLCRADSKLAVRLPALIAEFICRLRANKYGTPFNTSWCTDSYRSCATHCTLVCHSWMVTMMVLRSRLVYIAWALHGLLNPIRRIAQRLSLRCILR